MEYLIIAIKLIVGLSILNVWLLRSGKETQWRGGDAGSLEEEFKAYGLPIWFMWTVGGLKILFALGLLASIWFTGYPELETYSAYGIAVLMLGAVSMHIKVKDPLKKSLPAFTFLVLSLLIAFL
ncbi:DoxX family protein [Gracilimonas sediminicola]|uniref:DoxX family protein n=1 Tax=Gracilimonas sediminicola TaxID=2952158 RepID=A0A9X2L398_9BACT|nr:DoxX family protein [Gracilimonas sediminicola]MCP9291540.1 DoxX family protein [Gracilimonas sediminicola]